MVQQLTTNKMPILENKKELNRVFEIYQNTVKEEYRATSLDAFITQYYNELSVIYSDVMYIALSQTETISGHSEVIDW